MSLMSSLGMAGTLGAPESTLLFFALIALASLGWVALAIAAVPAFFAVRELARDGSPAPARWPRLSVVVPARDEADTIEAALTSLLASSYPDLEIVLVDDRSSDGTGEITERIAAKDPRVRVVHVAELPDGWLGKVHALEVGTRRASGEWVLYTDADVHFLPGCLERAVALGVAEGLDHLTLWPKLIARTLALRAMQLTFGVSLIAMLRPHRIGRPGSKTFMGIGAFNLVRRAAYDRSPGFEWLRMEVGDDVGLATLIGLHGGRSGWRTAYELLEIEWYPSVPSMIRGLEKNTYGIFSRFSPPLFFAKLAAILALAVAPFVAVLPSSPVWCRASGLVAFLAAGLVYTLGARLVGYGAAEVLLAPSLGSGVMLVALLRSAVACWREGGIRWRGTLYPVDALRRGQRVKL